MILINEVYFDSKAYNMHTIQSCVSLLLFANNIPFVNLLVVGGQVSQVLSGYFQVICDARCHRYQGFQVLPSEKER